MQICCYFLDGKNRERALDEIHYILSIKDIRANKETINYSKLDWYRTFFSTFLSYYKKESEDVTDLIYYLKFVEGFSLVDISFLLQKNEETILFHLSRSIEESLINNKCTRAYYKHLLIKLILKEKIDRENQVKIKDHLLSCECCHLSYLSHEKNVCILKSEVQRSLANNKPTKKVSFMKSLQNFFRTDVT
ncbi:MAG: hypothetical protein CME61_04820 [Halobacteriovoraceae bacterium]|nr:hypothetical protein [Halobacteriovoraceae bacterium]